jgi:murein L,D-transpeptidase YcbB/YkuD
VRVEDPMPLADFLLTGHPKWNMDFLKIEIGHKVEDKAKIAEYKKVRDKLRKDFLNTKTTEIYLSKKVPLYIDYYTCWVDENGEINFRDDIYGKDKILLNELLKMKVL